MRIIGGRWRGRPIAVPAKGDVRPTGDRVREAWFSIIQFELPGARVVDLCAGSGALGIESLSRGAAHVTFVDSAASSLATISRTLESLGADPASYALVRSDAERFVATLTAGDFTVGFADPPYALPLAAALCDAWRRVPFAALFGVEHPSALDLGHGGDRRQYGLTAISFFRG